MTAKKRERGDVAADVGRQDSAEVSILGSRATLISILVLAAAGLIFFWRVVFLGEILTGGDVLAAAAIFEDYANEQMAAGHLPLWNPYIFSGMPFFDSMSWSAFVYPSYWIKVILEKIPGVELPRLFFLFLHYELAGLGTYFYASFVGIRAGLVEIPLALFGAWAVTIAAPILPYAMGFAAGAMLYVISDEIVPETHRPGFERLATIGTMLGVIVMLYLDVTLG